MADKNKNNYLYIGIAAVVVIVLALVFLSNSNDSSQDSINCNSPYIQFGTSCCLDQNNNRICDSDEQPAKNQQQFDASKVIVKDATTNNDVYWNAKGGLAVLEQSLIIQNNNDIPITLKAGFTPSNIIWFMGNKLQNLNCYGTDAIWTTPDFRDHPALVNIEAHGSQQVQLRIYSGSQCAGSDSFRDVTPSSSSLKTSSTLQIQLVKAGEQNNLNQMIDSQSFTTTLHCINQDGTDDCKKLSQDWE